MNKRWITTLVAGALLATALSAPVGAAEDDGYEGMTGTYIDFTVKPNGGN